MICKSDVIKYKRGEALHNIALWITPIKIAQSNNLFLASLSLFITFSEGINILDTEYNPEKEETTKHELRFV